MRKDQLAVELRQRLLTKQLVPEHILESLSDDIIIDSYVTCSCCGQKQIEGRSLRLSIYKANDAANWLTLLESTSSVFHEVQT